MNQVALFGSISDGPTCVTRRAAQPLAGSTVRAGTAHAQSKFYSAGDLIAPMNASAFR